MLWFISIQYLCFQQYPMASQMCFPSTHLGGVLVGVSGSFGILRVFILALACWSCWVKLEIAAVSSAMVLLWVIIVSLSASAAVAKLMSELLVSSPVFLGCSRRGIPLTWWILFSPSCFLCCAAWKCAWKFAHVLSTRSLLSHLPQSS